MNLEKIAENERFQEKVNLLAKEAFPPKEYFAPKKMIEMAQTENFDFWALTGSNQFIGFMTLMTYQDLAYLFFLAIDPAYRSMGYGSQAIASLVCAYPDKKTCG